MPLQNKAIHRTTLFLFVPEEVASLAVGRANRPHATNAVKYSPHTTT